MISKEKTDVDDTDVVDIETKGWTEETYERFWKDVQRCLENLTEDAFDFLEEENG